MSKWIRRISALCLVMAMLCGFTTWAWADQGPQFVVSAQIPENQMDPSAAYFHLHMEPEQNQELVVRVENHSIEDMTVSVEALTASTNRNGIIHYGPGGIWDPDIPFLFSQIAEVVDHRLTIPAGSTGSARVLVRMPDEAYDGTMMGAIRVTKELDERDEDAQTGISNQFSYTIGVRLTETDTMTEPVFSLGQVGMELTNHKAAIVARVHNPQGAIVRDIRAYAAVTAKDSGSVVIEMEQGNIEMAPCSVFPMTLMDRAGYGFAPGDYTCVLELQHQGRVWSFEQDFVITQPEAETVNTTAVNQNRQPQPELGEISLAVVIVLVCAAALAITATILIKRR